MSFLSCHVPPFGYGRRFCRRAEPYSPAPSVRLLRWCKLDGFRLAAAGRAGDEEAAAQDVEADGEHHDRADRDLLPVGVDADHDETALDSLQQENAEEAARHRAGAAEQTDA